MSLNPVSLTSLAGILLSVLVLTLSGCGLWGDKRDTAHEGATSGRALEVPPDLLPPELDATYRVPAREDGRVSAVEAEQRQRPSGILEARPAPVPEGVALRQVGQMTVRREGNVRWLELGAAPADLWQSLREFWREQGFDLTRDEPALGVMETEWKDTAAGVPVPGVRGRLSRALGTAYDAGTRDQYRIRLERESEQVTNLYLTHRGVDQVIDEDRGGLRWGVRPSDPGLEAEMLTRLMVHLGREEGEARDIMNLAADEGPRLREREADGQPGLELRDQFAQVWRQVGLGLDRAGLLVDDQDRSAGIFHVTYSREAARARSDGGFFSRIFRRDRVGGDGRYQIHVAQEGDWVRVTARDREGNALRASDAASVLDLLADELR
jgi:outer membrane protein assembly factor BamC